MIRYQLPVAGKMSLKVYDLLGRKIATLYEDVRPPGLYDATFNAGGLVSGVYFCRLTAGMDFVQTKKLLLLK